MIEKQQGGIASAPKNPLLARKMKIALFRMWAAGAVCFFAAWGRLAPEEVNGVFSVNLIIGLIFVMILCDILIINPVIRLLSGKQALGAKKTGWKLVLAGPLHIAKVMALIILVVQTYYFLNLFFISSFGLEEDAVPVPLEPILFGILYGLYYFLSDLAAGFIRGKLSQ